MSNSTTTENGYTPLFTATEIAAILRMYLEISSYTLRKAKEMFAEQRGITVGDITTDDMHESVYPFQNEQLAKKVGNRFFLNRDMFATYFAAKEKGFKESSSQYHKFRDIAYEQYQKNAEEWEESAEKIIGLYKTTVELNAKRRAAAVSAAREALKGVV